MANLGAIGHVTMNPTGSGGEDIMWTLMWSRTFRPPDQVGDNPLTYVDKMKLTTYATVTVSGFWSADLEKGTVGGSISIF